MWKTHTFQEEIIKVLLRKQFKDCWSLDKNFANAKDNNNIIKKVITLKDGLEKAIKDEGLKNNNLDTLISKILLGTMGCTPAYDEYFKKGVKKYFKKTYGIQTFGKRSLEKLIGFYKDNKTSINEIKIKTKDKKTPYPIMKKLDMFFWGAGR